MNFGELKFRIEEILGRTPASVVYEMVTADINKELRLRVMQSTTTATEAASVALPTDFLAMVDVYRDTDPRTSLSRARPQSINRSHVTSGTPKTYAIVDGAMLLNPSPDGSETLQIRYIAKLADLTASSDENDVLTTYPDIYIYGALAHHAALIGDERGAIWEPKYQAAISDARTSDIKQVNAGSPNTVVRRGMTP